MHVNRLRDALVELLIVPDDLRVQHLIRGLQYRKINVLNQHHRLLQVLAQHVLALQQFVNLNLDLVDLGFGEQLVFPEFLKADLPEQFVVDPVEAVLEDQLVDLELADDLVVDGEDFVAVFYQFVEGLIDVSVLFTDVVDLIGDLLHFWEIRVFEFNHLLLLKRVQQAQQREILRDVLERGIGMVLLAQRAANQEVILIFLLLRELVD